MMKKKERNKTKGVRKYSEKERETDIEKEKQIVKDYTQGEGGNYDK